MTSTRYLISKVARAFGIHRRNQRMGEAVSETHLLREAEIHLGSIVWERVESIETLSADYWNLRKLAGEHQTLSAKISQANERLGKAHDERTELQNTTSDPEIKLHAQKAEIANKLNKLAIRRDEVIASAKEVRKSYEGLKVKSEVLSTQHGDSKPGVAELEKINSSLAELKARFTGLKTERDAIALEIEEGDTRINAIIDQIKEFKKDQYELTAKAFQGIGDVNRDISSYRAEIGLLEARMIQLQGVIGRHVSRNVSIDPACDAAAKGHQGLIDVMRALRKSITLNHKLAGM